MGLLMVEKFLLTPGDICGASEYELPQCGGLGVTACPRDGSICLSVDHSSHLVLMVLLYMSSEFRSCGAICFAGIQCGPGVGSSPVLGVTGLYLGTGAVPRMSSGVYRITTQTVSSAGLSVHAAGAFSGRWCSCGVFLLLLCTFSSSKSHSLFFTRSRFTKY